VLLGYGRAPSTCVCFENLKIKFTTVNVYCCSNIRMSVSEYARGTYYLETDVVVFQFELLSLGYGSLEEHPGHEVGWTDPVGI